MASRNSLKSKYTLFTKKHEGIINANRTELVDNILLDDLLNRLQSKGVLNTKEVAVIKGQGIRDEQVEKLLDVIVCKADSAFYKFIKALRKSGQKHIAMILEKAEDKIKTGKRKGTDPENLKSRTKRSKVPPKKSHESYGDENEIPVPSSTLSKGKDTNPVNGGMKTRLQVLSEKSPTISDEKDLDQTVRGHLSDVQLGEKSFPVKSVLHKVRSWPDKVGFEFYIQDDTDELRCICFNEHRLEEIRALDGKTVYLSDYRPIPPHIPELGGRVHVKITMKTIVRKFGVPCKPPVPIKFKVSFVRGTIRSVEVDQYLACLNCATKVRQIDPDKWHCDGCKRSVWLEGCEDTVKAKLDIADEDNPGIPITLVMFTESILQLTGLDVKSFLDLSTDKRRVRLMGQKGKIVKFDFNSDNKVVKRVDCRI